MGGPFMHFSWEEQTIRWFTDAGTYTGFHKTLARRIIPYLEQDDTLCDAGCGIGRLDLELAPYVRSITAVDVSENAIAALRRDAAAIGISNLCADVRDVDTMTEQFDIIILSFFGQKNMFGLLENCCRKLIRIVAADNKSKMYPEQHKKCFKDTIPTVCGLLDEKGLDYKLELGKMEFGQPLRSWHDAEQFVLSNAP